MSDGEGRAVVDHARGYEAVRGRIVDVVRDADPATPVPTCPGWTVKDVVAHLSGVLADFAAGRLDGVATPEWTARQVEERRAWSLKQCLEEWAANVDRARPIFDTPGAPILLADVVSHEHDLRTALGRPGARDSDEVRAAAATLLRGLEGLLRGAGCPPLRVESDVERVLGDGEPAGTLRASSFELLRAITGRRTAAQVRALDWDGDPDAWVHAFFVFGPASEDVRE